MTRREPTPAEARLRDALREVADATPVTDGLDRLGDEIGDLPVPLLPHHRPSPWGRRVLVAASIVVLAVGALAVSARNRDDGRDTLAVTPATSTGFYLPSDPSGRWDLVRIAVHPVEGRPGLVRRVLFHSGADPRRQVGADVTTDPPADAMPASYTRQEIERGAGTTRRTYEVFTRAGADGPLRVVHARTSAGDLFLALSSAGIDQQQPLLAMADRWWESDGRELAIDPAFGLQRRLDEDTRPAASAPRSGNDEAETAVEAVVVATFRGPSGRLVDMTLSPLGSVPRPTGTGHEDLGASAGLPPEDRPRPLGLLGVGDRAWSWPGTAITSPQISVEHAGIGIDLIDDRQDETTLSAPPVPLEVLSDLWSTLQPVDADRWADAVRALQGGRAAIAPDLASVPIPPHSRRTDPTPTTGR